MLYVHELSAVMVPYASTFFGPSGHQHSLYQRFVYFLLALIILNPNSLTHLIVASSLTLKNVSCRCFYLSVLSSVTPTLMTLWFQKSPGHFLKSTIHLCLICQFLAISLLIVFLFRLYKTDPHKYNECAREWTRKYAMWGKQEEEDKQHILSKPICCCFLVHLVSAELGN